MNTNVILQNATGTENIPSGSDFTAWAQPLLEHIAELSPKTANKITPDTLVELCIRVVTEEESQQLNLGFRNKDKPTNVLSFGYELPDNADLPILILGDLAICADVVVREAAGLGIPATEHWAHMVIHGILHLLGYDHQKPDDETIMTALEIKYMDILGYENPYPNTH